METEGAIKQSAFQTREQLIAFYIGAIVLSWLGWFPLLMESRGWIDHSVSPYFHLPGGLGPMLSAVIVTSVASGRSGVSDLLHRMFHWRGGPFWLLLVIAGPLFLNGAGALVSRAIPGEWIDFGAFGQSSEYPSVALSLVWVASLIFMDLGRKQDGAALRFRAFNTITVPSHLQSLSAFFGRPGIFRCSCSQMDCRNWESLALPGWYFSLLLGSVLLTWLHNSTGGSILIVAIFHATLDIAINSPADGVILRYVMGGLLTITGFLFIHRYGREHLSRRVRQSASCKRSDQPRRKGQCGWL